MPRKGKPGPKAKKRAGGAPTRDDIAQARYGRLLRFVNERLDEAERLYDSYERTPYVEARWNFLMEAHEIVGGVLGVLDEELGIVDFTDTKTFVLLHEAKQRHAEIAASLYAGLGVALPPEIVEYLPEGFFPDSLFEQRPALQLLQGGKGLPPPPPPLPRPRPAPASQMPLWPPDDNPMLADKRWLLA